MDPKPAPRRAKHLSYRTFHLLGFRAGGCPRGGVWLGCVRTSFSWRPLSSTSPWKPVRASWEPPTVPSSSFEVTGRREVGLGGRHVVLLLSWGSSLRRTRQSCRLIQAATRRTSRRKQDLSEEEFTRSMVKRHRFSSLSCFLEPSSNSVDDGFTAVLGCERCVGWKCRVTSSETVASKALTVRRRRVSSNKHRSAAVLLFQRCERGHWRPIRQWSCLRPCFGARRGPHHTSASLHLGGGSL